MKIANVARFACILWMSLLLGGCANLGAIREFGTISADTAGYTALTEEYATSPARRKKYTMAADTTQRAFLDQQASERTPQVNKLLLYHATVAEYMKSLADLAGGDVATFDPEIGKLTDAAKSAKYIDEAEANALKAIASAIANAATDFYRQRKLKTVIEQANAPLQLVLDDMLLLSSAFGESVDIESTDATRYYRVLETMARHDVKNPVTAELIWADSFAEDSRLKDRLLTVNKYKETLLKIKQAHQALYDNRDEVSAAEFQRQLRNYSKQILAAYQAVKAAKAKSNNH